jgi:hypothetical protein
MLTAADERRHPAGSKHIFWNESFYFSFLATDGGWGGSARIGFSPNQGCRDGFVIFYFPDGKAGFVRLWERSNRVDGEAAEVGALIFEPIAPFAAWRLRYDGPVFVFDDPADAANFHLTTLHVLPTRHVHIDLEFRTMHEPFDFHDAMRIRPLPLRRLAAKLRPDYLLRNGGFALYKLGQLRAMGGASHYEQGGHVAGTITIDGEPHAFAGHGQRDHSWGVRDMRVIREWQWFSCQFGDRMAFNATRVEFLGLAAVGGHVWHKGRCRPLRRLALQMEPAAAWPRPQAVRLRLDVGGGDVYKVAATTRLNLPVHVTTEGRSAIVHEGLATFRWQDTEASGIAEFMHQVIR